MASERIPSYPLNDEYDIRQAFARIEDEIIASMMRNLGHHLKEEKEEGFDWSQWQVEQLKYLQELRRRNLKEYGPRFKSINEKIEEAIRDAHENGQKEEELNILKAISQDKKIRPKYANPSQPSIEGAGDAFFRVNDRKLEALVEAAHSDMEKAEHAVLRRTNDQYRKIIFDAQMYANTGAGTIEKAIDMAAKDFLAKGIDSIEYKNGARHTISDYADMYLRTAERRAYLMGEGKKRQEWGEKLVIVNRRGTMTGGNYGHACPKCIPWLGKILIDDVYSGGKPDGKHELLSDAMAAGFLHPRCKDGFTTYIPGISPQEDPVTKKEVTEAVEAEKGEARGQYAERQQKKYERLAEYSLDPENKRVYEARADEWDKLRNAHFKTGGTTSKNYADQKRLEEELRKRADDFPASTEDDTRAALLTEANKWDKILSAREKRSITKYAFNMGDKKGHEFFRRLNAALSGREKITPSLKKHADNISSGLKKFSLKESIVCFRGVDINPVEGKKVGDLYFPKHFLSSSISQKGAFKKAWVLEIHASPGAAGGFIENYSPYGERQAEFLFDKDCGYRILKISGNKIVLEVIS